MTFTKESAELWIERFAPDGIPSLDADKDTFKSVCVALDSIDLFLEWQEARIAEAESKSGGSKAGPCPISEAQFASAAPELVLSIFGSKLKTLRKYGKPRLNSKTKEESGGRFKSGAFGYWFGGRVTLNIDGKDVEFQAGGQLVAVNSKDGPKIP